jgi:hypothetical protein
MKLQFAVVVSLAVIVGSAVAQPPGINASRSSRPSSNIILERGGQDIDKDLGVNDDLARSLAQLREEYQAAKDKAYQDAGINPRDIFSGKMAPAQVETYARIGIRVNEEYISKAAALLSPDQIKRLRQIEFQISLSERGVSAIQNRDVAQELRLTAEQRQTINSLNSQSRTTGPTSRVDAAQRRALYLDAAIDLLTDEQKAVLSELKGKEFKSRSFGLGITAGPAIAPQNGAARGSGVPLRLLQGNDIVRLAAIEAVQQDLGVSDAVASKLTVLRDEYLAAIQKEYQDAGLSPIYNPNELTDVQRQQHVEIGRRLNNQFFPKAEELLSADQQKRIQQIQFRSRLNANAPMALLSADVAPALKLTDDQRQTLDTLRREYGQNLVFGRASDVAEKAKKHREDYAAKAVEVLTAEQKEIVTKLKGNEFDLSKLVVRSSGPPRKGN